MMKSRKKMWRVFSVALLVIVFIISGCSIATPDEDGNNNKETEINDNEKIERFGVELENLDLDQTLNGQYEGQTLTIPVMSGDFEDAINEVVPIFEELSGAKVNIESVPGDQLTDKIQLDISNTHRYDVILAPIANLHSYAESGSILNIQEYVDEFASDSYDIGDFLPGLFDVVGKHNGELVAIPYKPDVQLLFYRKDLFEDEQIKEQYKEKYGEDLKVPETNEEMEEVSEFFTKSMNPDSPIDYGYVNSMLKGASRWLWINRGAEVVDENGEPAFNNEAGIKAMDHILALQESAPNEWLQMGWDEGNQFFVNGNAAMMEQWPGLWGSVQADTSEVKDKVGMAITPGKTPVLGGWGISIATESDEKELAWKFIEFVTSKDGELLKINYTMDPTRESVYEIAGVSDFNPNYNVFMESLSYGNTLADVDVPYVTAQLNDVTEIYVQHVLNEELLPEEALDAMEKDYHKVIEEMKN